LCLSFFYVPQATSKALWFLYECIDSHSLNNERIKRDPSFKSFCNKNNTLLESKVINKLIEL
jgi:hypothetical protein